MHMWLETPFSSRISHPKSSFSPDEETAQDDDLYPALEKVTVSEQGARHRQPRLTGRSRSRVPNNIPQAVECQGGEFHKLLEAYSSGWLLQPSQAPSQSFLCPVLAREFRSRSWYSRDKKFLSGAAPQLLTSPKEIVGEAERQGGAVINIGAIIKVHCVSQTGLKMILRQDIRLLLPDGMQGSRPSLNAVQPHDVPFILFHTQYSTYANAILTWLTKDDFLALYSAHPIKTSYKISLIRYANAYVQGTRSCCREGSVYQKILTPSLTQLGISQDTQQRRDSSGMALPVWVWAHILLFNVPTELAQALARGKMHQYRQHGQHGHPVHMNTGRLGYVTRRGTPAPTQVNTKNRLKPAQPRFDVLQRGSQANASSSTSTFPS
ncbi:hypothetical protein BKA70DRAFT_1233053 [Coprinopsis sp. MPI-PUGE-AT-0042]|nr:hypothetical protein BKA70DRAFT_1233053 [Coprinopsis sp. MPI-PUGE-AT-0042]